MVAAGAFSRVRFGWATPPVWASGADPTFLGGPPGRRLVQPGLHRARDADAVDRLERELLGASRGGA